MYEARGEGRKDETDGRKMERGEIGGRVTIAARMNKKDRARKQRNRKASNKGDRRKREKQSVNRRRELLQMNCQHTGYQKRAVHLGLGTSQMASGIW